MLRAQGIPVRLVTGFSTINRSFNNPGWYWYYADQAHAWNQVYFPGYGWLDFDFTISNEDAEEAPQPDATPPAPPTKAYFVAKGIITSLDTAERSVELNMSAILLNDRPLNMQGGQIHNRTFDAKSATVYAGEQTIKFNDLKINDSALVVSFNDKIKSIKPFYENEPAAEVLKRLPKLIEVHEIHTPEIKHKEEKEDTKKEETLLAKKWLMYFLWLIPSVWKALANPCDK